MQPDADQGASVNPSRRGLIDAPAPVQHDGKVQPLRCGTPRLRGGDCHAPATKLPGSSFPDVAGRYRADAAVAATVAAKIHEGGAGAWGPVPMPPHPHAAHPGSSRIAE